MTLFEELNVDPENSEEKLASFRQFSRNMLYMALFQNEALDFSVFEGDSADSNSGPNAGNLPGADSNPDTAQRQQQLLMALARHLHSQMLDEFDDPEQFSIEAWVELAQQLQPRPKNNEKDLTALSLKIYRLLKQQLTLERERQIRGSAW